MGVPTLLLLCVAQTLNSFNNYMSSRAVLLAARDEWCVNPAQVESMRGPLGQWTLGTSITDLSYVFCSMSGNYWRNKGCNDHCAFFDVDVSLWNIAGVTNMQVRARDRLAGPVLG